MLEIIVCTVIIVLGLAMFWSLYVEEVNKRFEKYLKVGDIVDYYVFNQREMFTVAKMGEIFIEIVNIETGEELRVPIGYIYPHIGFNYKPKVHIE